MVGAAPIQWIYMITANVSHKVHLKVFTIYRSYNTKERVKAIRSVLFLNHHNKKKEKEKEREWKSRRKTQKKNGDFQKDIKLLAYVQESTWRFEYLKYIYKNFPQFFQSSPLNKKVLRNDKNTLISFINFFL